QTGPGVFFRRPCTRAWSPFRALIRLTLEYCKRLNLRGLKFSPIAPKLKIFNYSRVLIFANRM
ncbi:MAG: hypothetical protein PV344_05360, partial [Anaplasma sp.]|nr:hypothetical protein [Anaplasma sp.]